MKNLTCEMFIRLVPHFEGTLSRIAKDGVSLDEWSAHLHECPSCSDALLTWRVQSWGIDASRYPCIHMAYRANQTCPMHENRDECPDLVIGYDEVIDEYSLIKDGVSLIIDYCPWCGAKLPPSQRNRWHTELEALLGPDPLKDWEKVPKRYRSREWRG